MGSCALSAGIAVLALTVATQIGLLGGRDFLTIALIGLGTTIGCLMVAFQTRSTRAGVGAALAGVPVVMLAYFLLSSDG